MNAMVRAGFGARIGRPAAASAMRLPIVAAVLLATSLAGCNKPPEAKAELIRPVRAEVVATAPLAQTAIYSGDVWPRYQSTLGFRIAGKITQRKVDVGQQVKKDDVLAVLDPVDAGLAADRARSALAAAEADLSQAQTDHDRYKQLLVSNTISQADFDRRLNTLNAAMSRAKSARAELEMARNQSEYTTLKADADGVVVAVEAEAGEVVTAGAPVVRIAQSGAKEVVIAVPESRLGDIRDARRIDVAMWASPGTTHVGTVREIAPRADAATRTYAVKIAIDDDASDIKLGMTATVNVILGGEGEAIMVPPTALTQVGKDPAVWVVDTNTGTVKLRMIKVAAYREDKVVVAEGLSPGETVVTAGAHKLVADQHVRVLDKAARL